VVSLNLFTMASTGPPGTAGRGTGPGFSDGGGGDAADNPEWQGRARGGRHRRAQPCGACGWPYVHRLESETRHGFCTNVQCFRSAASKEARRFRHGTEDRWSGLATSTWRQSPWLDANEPEPAEPEAEAATGLVYITGVAPTGQGPSRDLPVRPVVHEPTPVLVTLAGASLRRRRWADQAGPIAMELAPRDFLDGLQMPPSAPLSSAEADALASSPGYRTRVPNPALRTDADLANANGVEVPVHCLVGANWPRVAMLVCSMSDGLLRTVVVNCQCGFCFPLQNRIRAHLEANNAVSRADFTII